MLYTLFYNYKTTCAYNDSHIVIYSYFTYCRTLCLRFSDFIYSHCPLFLHYGIIYRDQQSPYVQDLVSSRDVQNSLNIFSHAATLGIQSHGGGGWGAFALKDT